MPVRGAFDALAYAEASARRIPGRHTAWEILLHLDTWHRGVSRRLRGEVVVLSAEEDWPPAPDSTAENWRAALARLDAGFDEFLESVREFPNDDVFEPLHGAHRTAYETIIGIGEHDLHHTGQVTL